MASGRSKSSAPRSRRRARSCCASACHALELGQELLDSSRARRGSRRRAPRRRRGSRGAPCERITAAQKYASWTAPLAIEVDAHHHRAAIDLGVERADPRRQLLGQHRDRAVGQVDRAAAHARLAIERRRPAARSARRRRPRPTGAPASAPWATARRTPRRRSRARSRDRSSERRDRAGRRDRRDPRCAPRWARARPPARRRRGTRSGMSR